jgi:hypothetical protein
MSPLNQFKTTVLPCLTAISLSCFGLSPKTQASDLGSVVAGNNTADGSGVLVNLTTGTNNSGFGFQALHNNSTGSFNTATGARALLSNTTGLGNTATGLTALQSNTSGGFNTATGDRALLDNTMGSNNTATGTAALAANTTGDSNTASGFRALRNNTTGSHNTATGFQALFGNTTIGDLSGEENTANGDSALYHNTTGTNNIADGFQALFYNTDGSLNTAIGSFALSKNTGSSNTAIGHATLFNKTTGGGNIALGDFAGNNLNTGDNNIYIGNRGGFGESNTIRIGFKDEFGGGQTATYIAGISGSAIAGTPVVVNANGRLGIATSSSRFKDEIKPMDKASEVIHALKPVSFRYKKELDQEGIPQFGLVAEDVEKASPDLVSRDEEGKAFIVRYEAVNAMLLNEFLKEHRTVQGQQKEIDALKAELKEQKALIQKVSAQIEVTKPAPQTVVNNNQ